MSFSLRGREYRGDASLNEACLGWLERTGNGKVHSSTRQVPKEEWLKEREYLIPLKPHQRVAAAYPEAGMREFIEALKADKPRYLHDNVRVLMKGMEGFPEHVRKASLAYCLENRIFNASVVVEVASKILEEGQRPPEPSVQAPVMVSSSFMGPTADMVPARSSISTYATILNV